MNVMILTLFTAKVIGSIVSRTGATMGSIKQNVIKGGI
jgi:hypothetical protein